MIRIKRVYDKPSTRDGMRILVDRVWPRGVSKERARAAEWRKDLAPSNALRKWFGHDPAKWKSFCSRYRAELTRAGRTEALKALFRSSRRKTITLIYGAADEEHNQAVALKELLDEHQVKQTTSKVREPTGKPSRAKLRHRSAVIRSWFEQYLDFDTTLDSFKPA
ncbi:MAG: DUF488 domain-containing protein [Nitrospiraceae bacterium]